MLNSGTRLCDRYEILSPLGAGGMGVVYRARDLRLDREVAVKLLPNHLSRDHDAMSRFQREAKALAALSHAGILSIYDFDYDQGYSFTVMELLKGETLRYLLVRKRLSWKESIQIGEAIAKGLQAAHSQHVIHRDLKPENIFLTLEDGVKILDFGLARIISEADSADPYHATKEGVILGTFPYMSPEQIRGKRVDTRTDIFSFGCILFEMFTGSPAFSGAGQAEITASILKEDPVSREDWPDEIPPYIKTTVRFCLEKNPEHRFQNMKEVASALKGARTPILQTTLRNSIKPKTIFLFFAIAAILAIATYAFTSKHREIQSIAVLPFANSTNDADAEYLSDGITETLIRSLSKLPNLRVMAHDTVFSYKGKMFDPRKIGQDLKVEAVLTGKVVQRGNTLTVYTNLVNVSDGAELWGDQYNRPLTDLVMMQSDISRDISGKLRSRITGEQQESVAKNKTPNSEAYQLYLKGEYLFYKFDGENFLRAKSYFEQATHKDPNFAEAWAGIGDCYGGLTFGGYVPASELSKGKRAAQRALQLDSSITHSHLTMGRLYFMDWNWRDAEKELQRAIQINPNEPENHRTYSEILRSMGRWNDAIAEAKKAHELDPLSVVHTETLGITYFWAGQPDLAIPQYKKALELEENRAAIHDSLADAYAKNHFYKEALEEKQRSLILSGDSDSAIELAKDFEKSGYQAAMKVLTRNYLETYRSAADSQYVSPLIFAVLYTELDDREKAFEWLEKSFQERSVWLINLKADPQFDRLRSDPRFKNLVKKIGIPD